MLHRKVFAMLYELSFVSYLNFLVVVIFFSQCILQDQVVNSDSFLWVFFDTLFDQVDNLGILEFSFKIVSSLSMVPLLLRISRELVYGGRHVHHNHSSGKNINLAGVIMGVRFVFRCNELRILSRCGRSRHCLGVLNIHTDWIKVGQLNNVVVFKHYCPWVNASMQRLLLIESL